MPFLTDFETNVTTGFITVANTFGGGLLATFRPAFIVGFGIWITLIAYEVAFGKSEDGFTYLFTKIGKVFLIGVLALYGWPELAELLNGIKEGFVGTGAISTVLQTNLIDPLSLLWDNIIQLFTAVMAPLGFTDIPKILVVVLFFVIAAVAYLALVVSVGAFGIAALAMYLVANSIFILLLAVGPVFLLCLAFPFLQRFFESFIGSVITSILGMAFTALMVLFVANIYDLTNIQSVVTTTGVTASTFAGEAQNLAVTFASRAATVLLIIYLYFKIFDLASALGGGLNMGANMIRGISSVMRAARSGSSGSRPGATTNQIASGGGGVRALGRNAGSVALAGAANVSRIASYGAGRAIGTASRFAYNRTASARNSINSVG